MLFALSGCAAASTPAAPRETASASAVAASSSSAVVASKAVTGAAPDASAPLAEPASTATGASRDTRCEKALFDLERAAAPAIDACLGRDAPPRQPITIQVQVDGSGRIEEAVWDQSTTTRFGSKAAFCILKAVKSVAFDEPACSKETLMVRRAAAPTVFDARL